MHLLNLMLAASMTKESLVTRLLTGKSRRAQRRALNMSDSEIEARLEYESDKVNRAAEKRARKNAKRAKEVA